MSFSDIPSITLPVQDYDRIMGMTNHSVVRFFRREIWLKRARFQPNVRIPDEHDAYNVSRQPTQVVVTMWREGKEIFSCTFVPETDY